MLAILCQKSRPLMGANVFSPVGTRFSNQVLVRSFHPLRNVHLGSNYQIFKPHERKSIIHIAQGRRHFKWITTCEPDTHGQRPGSRKFPPPPPPLRSDIFIALFGAHFFPRHFLSLLLIRSHSSHSHIPCLLKLAVRLL